MRIKIEDSVEYNPETGVFRWKISDQKKRKGEIAGYFSGGYQFVGINGFHYRGARLAWYLSYGYWPKEVDHINQDGTDDRLCNLRELPHPQNIMNTKARTASGEKGIYRITGGWLVQLVRNYKTHYIGYFSSLGDAIAARNAWQKARGE